MKSIMDFILVFTLLFVSGVVSCVEKSASVPSVNSNEMSTATVVATDELQIIKMAFYQISVPKEMKRLNVEGIDTLVARFEGSMFSLETEYGKLVDPSPGRLQIFEYSDLPTETIDGRRVKVYSYKSSKAGEKKEALKTIVGYFENARNDGNNLLIEVDCLMGIDCEPEARTVIRSVRFNP